MIPAGLYSNYIAGGGLSVGDEVLLAPPSGHFNLPAGVSESDKTVVMIAAGSGLTPLLSMTHDLVKTAAASSSTRRVVWFYAAGTNEQVPWGLLEEMKALNASSSNVTVEIHTYISRGEEAAAAVEGVETVPTSASASLPTEEPATASLTSSDKQAWSVHQSTRLTAEDVLANLTGADEASNAQIMLCGGSGFMRSMAQGLMKEGAIKRSQIAYENFGPLERL